MFRNGGAIWAVDPPFAPVAGPWGLDEVVAHLLTDSVARIHRMKGFNVLYPAVLSRTGPAADALISGGHKEDAGGSRGRTEGGQSEPKPEKGKAGSACEGRVERCRALLDGREGEALQLFRRLGISVNSIDPKDVVRTDDPAFRRVVQAAFIELYRKGLIAEGERPWYVCLECGAPAPASYVEEGWVEAPHYRVRLKPSSGGALEATTTRPELLFAAVAVLVPPDGGERARRSGATAIVPVANRRVPVIAHEAAGDGPRFLDCHESLDDRALVGELGLEPVDAIAADGKMTKAAGDFAGKAAGKCRAGVVAALEEGGHLAGTGRALGASPTCRAGGHPLVVLPTRGLFLDLARPGLATRAKASGTRFHPKDGLAPPMPGVLVSCDGPCGVEVPLWRCTACRAVVVPEPGGDYRPWRDAPPARRCERCGGSAFEGDGRTLDPLIEAGAAHLHIMGFMRDDVLFGRSAPCAFGSVEGSQLGQRGWSAILCSSLLSDAPAYEHVLVRGSVFDRGHRRLSMCEGLERPVLDVLTWYGSDAVRLWACEEAPLGTDVTFYEGRLAESERFVQRVFTLLTSLRDVPLRLTEEGCAFTDEDRALIESLGKVITTCEEAYYELDLGLASRAIRGFVDKDLSSYLGRAKERAMRRAGRIGAGGEGAEEGERTDEHAAQYTIHLAFRTALKLLAPLAPFITDYAWRELYSAGSVHAERLPEWRLAFGSERPRLDPIEWRTYRIAHGAEARDERPPAGGAAGAPPQSEQGQQGPHHPRTHRQ